MLSESAMDVALFVASWKEVSKGLGFGRYWKALGSFGRLWRVQLALQSFVRLWEALLGGLERLRKVMGGFLT